ncbi:MAG: helix-turn-helix domain-containing protein [Eubacteriales bacterium]|nr:helix-turn-helix domain-containing protein [Eubacteriales bacterium]
MNDLADRIRLMRQAQNLNQSQLALRVGVAQAYISEIEKGKKTPSVDVLEKLCDALDCSADYLLGITQSRHYKVVKEESLPAELRNKGLSLEVLQEVFDRNISESDIKLALRLAKVIRDEQNNNA